MEKAVTHLSRIIRRFRGKTVGVLGDYMLDELLRGVATRISPEAPVPVVVMRNGFAPERFPGGAGNVAANIAALGGKPVPFGAIGPDAAGRELLALFKAHGIASENIVREPGRVTPHKIRIVAHQQQLLRMDHEQPANISPRTAELLARSFTLRATRIDALIVSDYQKGSVTTELVNQVKTVARQRRLPIFVDPKPEHPEVCRHATLVTPNLREAEMMAGRPLRNRQEILMGGRRLMTELDCSNLLITLGGEGMVLFEAGGEVTEIASVPRPVYDVTGAGDTVIAVLALATTAGASMGEAAQLANLAGGCAVLKFGTAEITSRELLDALQAQS